MSAPDASDAPVLTVYSDYVCPFCYLGRHALRQYQASREGPLRIDWHPFDLRAGERGPEGGIDGTAPDGKSEAYYERARENVRRLRERYGVEMAREIATGVDSLPAQIASYHVKREYAYGTWLDFDEAVFAALWRRGENIDDRALLVGLATDAGVDADGIGAALADEGLRATVLDRFETARRAGVTGVPTFAYGDHAARGAVPPEHLRRLVEGDAADGSSGEGD